MKATTLKKAALVAGSLSFLAGSAFSQTAVSGAGGYTTHNLAIGFNLIGISLHNPVATSGAIDSEAGDTITVASPADLTAILTDATATYLVEILDGAQAGAVAEISNLTATSFDVAGGLGAGTAAYQIRPASTLASVFGSTLADAGGPFPDAATDQVWVVNPTAAGGFSQYFRNSTGDWKDAAAAFGASQNDLGLFYPEGLFVQVADTAKDLVVTGMVKNTSTVVAANEGFNLVGVTPPVGAELGNSNLAGTLSASAGPFPDATTDQVWLVNTAAPGGFSQYFLNSGGAWKDAAAAFGADADTTALTSGIFIQRAAGNGDTAGGLDVPAFYANL